MSAYEVAEPVCCDVTSNDAVELVVDARPRAVGNLTVARVLPTAKRRSIGPFVLLDHMGPVVVAPGDGFDVKPHPHIGLSTVTYFFEGENVHRDSLGSVQTIRPGDVNLMTAGRGVVHSERSAPDWRTHGGALDGVQIWLALPVQNEEDEPTFEHHPAASVPSVTPVARAQVRVLMGSAFGKRGPVSHPSDPLLIDMALDAGTCIDVDANAAERAVFAVSGDAAIGKQALVANRLSLIRAGAPLRIESTTRSRLLILGGESVGPRFIDWNFVSSSKARIDEARRAWKAQTFRKIPGDDAEFAPLPDLPRREDR